MRLAGPQEGTRRPLYLGEAAVTVILWTDGQHAHEPLLPLWTRLPGSGFLLRLPKTGHRLFGAGEFPLGCPRGGVPASQLPPVSPSCLHLPPLPSGHCSLITSPPPSLGPPPPHPSQQELTTEEKESDQLGEWHFRDYVLFLTGYTNNTCYT